MSQTVWSSINPATTSGTQLATILNDFKNAVMSGLTGTSRPTQTTAGGGWIDTTNAGSPNFYWSFKIYTGSEDVEVFRINLSTGRATISGTDSEFEVSRISADAVGPFIEFIKERVATNGQVLSGDVIGEMRFTSCDDDGNNPVVAKLQVVAAEDHTDAAQGSYLVWTSTPTGAAAAAEWMRLQGGKLGIGTQAPAAMVHTVGTTGIKAEHIADDANPAKVTVSKSRIAGTGATENSDVIGEFNFETTDDATAKSVSAKIKATAIEDHTDAAQGTKLTIQTAKTGAATLTDSLDIGDEVEAIVPLKINAEELVSQNVATSATIAQLSAAKAVVEFTGSTATTIQGVNSGHASKTVLLHNRSSASVTIAHENGTATAADRVKLPSSEDVTLRPDESVELYYCTADTRWKLKSGSGSIPEGSISPDKLSDTIELVPAFGSDFSGNLANLVPQFEWTTPAKMSDPGTLPSSAMLSADWSPNGEFLAIGSSSIASSYLFIYQRTGNGTTLVKLANPGTLPAGAANGVKWSPNGEFLAVAHASSPYITIYQRSGSTFTKLTNPGTLPAGNAYRATWSGNGEFLAVSHLSSPYITIYQRSGTTFTKLTNPGTLPAGNSFGSAFSPSGRFLAVAHTTTPFVTIYERSGTTFTKLTDPGTLPAGNANKVAWSGNEEFLAITNANSPTMTVYQRSGTTFTKISDPASPPADTYGLAWTLNSKYLAVIDNSFPYLKLYERSGTTLTLISNPSGLLPVDQVFDVAWTQDNQYMTVVMNDSPYVETYQTASDMPSEGVVVIKGKVRDGQ